MILGLLIGHAVADGPLQPAWLSQWKRDPDFFERWRGLLLHGLAHAGMVAIVTGCADLAAIELIAHCSIDRAKGRGWINGFVDQALHVACKLAYVWWLS